MTGRLSGKRALVTAAGAGIGAATARAFAREGAQVIATDIDAEALAGMAETTAQLTTGAPLIIDHLDVTDALSIVATVQRHGPFDVLFNCAGWVPHGSVLDCSEAEWTAAFEVNVSSMFRMIKATLPAMLEMGCGSIVNVSSMASSLCGTKDRCAYGASKAAVIGLTKSVAADFIDKGVRCNAICPAVVQTPSLDARIRERGGDEETARRAFVARQKMGRIGRPEEIAAIAVHLASDESAFTTGTAVIVDGGRSL